MSGVRQEGIYIAVQKLHEQKGYPIVTLCKLIHLNRSSYYKWLNRDKSRNELENEGLVGIICALYAEYDGILGYRRMTMYINRRQNCRVNHKRVYRLMKLVNLKSVIRKKKYHYKKSTPQITADNILNRQFSAPQPNEKWLTDVTELKYGRGQKAYLSAILDLTDRRIVSFIVAHRNDNPLVFQTFENAVAQNPSATPLFHSDRGFQYTSKAFRYRLDQAGMQQSMSRVGRCIDNGPMEGFWGILKSEMYYRHKFKTFDALKAAVESYMHFYNYDRLQERLGSLTPMEFHNQLCSA